MGKAYKNFWSLNTDEAVVSGILQDVDKNAEILMPLNAQMKGIDLVLLNTKSKKIKTIQVKGSRAYEPRKNEIKKFGAGSAGWFFFKSEVINKATADYFVFLIYVLEEVKKIGKRIIEPHTITIPTKKLKELSEKNKRVHGSERYSFLIWINPKTKEAFDFRDEKIDFSEYLDRNGHKILVNSLD